MNTENENMYQSAIDYLDKGLNVLLLQHKGKKPIGGKSWLKYQKEKVTKEILEVIKYRKFNIGVIGGAISNNLFIVDIDWPEFAEIILKIFPPTFTVKTSKGYHFYYYAPETIPSGKILYCKHYINNKCSLNLKNSCDQCKHKRGIDIKAEGGYVVASPSIHPTGILYEKINTLDIKTQKFEELHKILHDEAKKLDLYIRTDYRTSSRSRSLSLSTPLPSKTNKINKINKINKTKSTIFIEKEDQSLIAMFHPDSGLRPCIKELIDKMETQNCHFSHTTNVAIGAELIANGFGEQAFQNVFSLATRYNEEKQRIDYDVNYTRTQFYSLAQKDNEGNFRYNPFTCSRLTDMNLCLGAICQHHKDFTPSNLNNVELKVETNLLDIDIVNEEIENIEEEEEEEEEENMDWVATKDIEPDFINLLPEDHFISRYIQTCQLVTDAYPEYHFANAIFALNFATQRHLLINVNPDQQYPNTFLQLLGKPGYSRKSSAAKLFIKKILWDKDVIYPQGFSIEKLPAIVNQQPTGLFFYDEYANFEALSQRPYMKGIKSLLSELYYCPEKYKQSFQRGDIIIENCCPFFLSTVQPKYLADNVKLTDLYQGFLTRFLNVYCERRKSRLPRTSQAPLEANENFSMLKTWLTENKDFFETNFSTVPMLISMTQEAEKRLEEWGAEKENRLFENNDDEVSTLWQRVEENILKIATAFVLGDSRCRNYFQQYDDTLENDGVVITPPQDSDGPLWFAGSILKISLEYMNLAIHYAESLFFPSANKMLNQIKQHQDQNRIDKIHDLILSHPGITRAELTRKTRYLKKDMDAYLEVLEEGRMICVKLQDSLGRGRSTVKYFALKEDSI